MYTYGINLTMIAKPFYRSQKQKKKKKKKINGTRSN